ncbi:DUF2946 domain-containing protein [Halomonas binhaiensis]|uniref:DUF2946 domain-containing protein n=1 Tax=Halomonas binhaiensis TaxID=2562282 RepID=A0A5C1NIE4_9GAMM|nr:DUF2946 domain-containing protein [Halomonas binhaiensis]QEM83084.1 DUF2946 domain-containing protein [Halomonas binhaiensis]
MLSRSARFQRWLGYLALFAMLMMFIGPVISQTQRLLLSEASARMAASTGVDASPGVDASTGVGKSTRTSHEHHHGHHGDSPFSSLPGSPESGSHHDLSACGYCVLFTLVPGQAIAVVLPDLIPPRNAPPVAINGTRAPPSRAYTHPETRAPPALFS